MSGDPYEEILVLFNGKLWWSIRKCVVVLKEIIGSQAHHV